MPLVQVDYTPKGSDFVVQGMTTCANPQVPTHLSHAHTKLADKTGSPDATIGVLIIGGAFGNVPQTLQVRYYLS